MSFPKGPVWQELRQRALTIVPEGVKVGYNSSASLYEWRRSGYYRVSGYGSRAFFIECSPEDIGAVLFSEAQALLNHAAEHRASLRSVFFSNDYFSPSWALVTVYYWAFFSVLAFSRIVGGAFHYLHKEDIQRLKLLLGDKGCRLGSGAYELNYLDEIGSSMSKYELKKSNSSNYHEGVWRNLLSCFNELFENHASDDANSQEYFFYLCLKDGLGGDLDVWPTKLRNYVNYRPGAVYREARRESDVDLFRFVRSNNFSCIDDLIWLYKDELGKVSGRLEDNIRGCSRLLLLKALFVNELAEELIGDVGGRRRLDRRWVSLRKQYLDAHDIRQDVDRYALL